MQKETENDPKTGEMRKRRETMADGKRYIIYYTFGETSDEQEKPEKSEVSESV